VITEMLLYSNLTDDAAIVKELQAGSMAGEVCTVYKPLSPHGDVGVFVVSLGSLQSSHNFRNGTGV
jgi:hypothetical protein